MSFTDNSQRIRDMRDYAEKAIRLSKGKTRADLDSDEMYLLAMLRCIEVIGEAASKVSAEVRAQYPHIPWKITISIRNRLIHGYGDVNHDVIWQTIQEDLPPLIADLDKILDSEK